MRGKEKGGILKKVSDISPLAVIIAIVIVLGLSAVSGTEQTHKIDIIEPGPETTESLVNIGGTILFINGTIDESITNATLTYDSTEEIIPVVNGKFSYPITLSPGENKLRIKIETEGGSLTTIHDVTYNPPTAATAGEGEETGFTIPAWVVPWAIVGIIVFISFLIFFVFVWKNETEQIYTFIIWIASAIIIPIALFFVLFYLKIEKFGFNQVIVAILLSMGVPLLYALLSNFIEERGKIKEKLEELSEEALDSFHVNFKVFDEKNEQLIPNAKISVSKLGSSVPKFGEWTDPFAERKLEQGKYEYRIEPAREYKPKLKTFSVERSGTVSIPLSKRTGNLTVHVKDQETGNPVQGVNVSVNGVEKGTGEQGKALFPSLSIGAKEIKIDEIIGVYSSETETCEIKEDTTTDVSVALETLLRIPIDKDSKLSALRNQLQDNYRRVSTYDPCIPSYFKSIVDNMVNLVKGMAGKPILFVGSKNNPGEIIGHLIDAVDLTSHEIIGVMSSKRNVDVYSAAMKLEKAEVGAKPIDFDDSRVLDYIQDAEDFYNSYYHTAQSKLFEIDTNITRKTGEMNVLPVSGLWRVARTLLNETSASSAETDGVKKGAMTLVADILLDYADGMLKDAKIIERLKIMVI